MEDAGADDPLTALIEGNGGVDPIETNLALAQARAALVPSKFRPVALGRYVLLDVLGAGGSGTVYRAYDPDLHRRVAVKVLRTSPGVGSSGGTERLLREAQAIARIGHPNVIRVYDVGTVAVGELSAELERSVFVVMELLEGVTLADWMERSHPLAEVLNVFGDAGRGLAAAHRDGVIHRDFKPSNVLVEDGGMARVLDFGLARSVDGSSAQPEDEPSAPGHSSPELLGADLTVTGTVMGTPVYMAPEQHLGQRADARADQYSFCVALYEAVYRQRPFGGATIDELKEAKSVGPRRPASSRVPAWLGAVLVRGLDPDPARRFDDMDALLGALERRSAKRLRRGAWMGAVLVGALLAGVGLTRAGTPARCAEAGASLLGIWDEDIVSRGQATFSGHPHGDETWLRVQTALDAYAEAWTSRRRETCEATIERGEASPEDMALRSLCLDRQRTALGELTRLLVSADADVVARAPETVARLRAPSVCAGELAGLQRELGFDTSRGEHAAQLDTQLLRADVLTQMGRYDAARELAAEVVERAEGYGDYEAQARGLLLDGRGLLLTNQYEQARDRGDRALIAAERAGDGQQAVEATVLLANVEDAYQHYRVADRMYRLAQARFEALGANDKDLTTESRLRIGLALLYGRERRFDAAIETLTIALDRTTDELGVDHPDTLPLLNVMGLVEIKAGRFDAALGYYEDCLERAVAVYGPWHPGVGSLQHNVAGVYIGLGDLASALASTQKALETKQVSLGADSPRLANTYGRLGSILTQMGRPERALEHHARAVALASAARGDDHPLVATYRIGTVAALRVAGRCEGALVELDRVQALLRGATETDVVTAGAARIERGRCFLDMGEAAMAIPELEAGIAHAREAGGADAGRRLVVRLHDLARAQLAVADAGSARANLEEALSLCDAAHGDPVQEGRVQLALAQLLVDEDPARADALAAAAHAAFEGAEWARSDLRALEDWMAKR